MVDSDTCVHVWTTTTRRLTKSPLERKYCTVRCQLTLSAGAAPGRMEVVRPVALLLDCVCFDVCVPSQLRLTFTSACG